MIGIFAGSLGCPPSSSGTTDPVPLRRPLLPLLGSLLRVVSMGHLELDDRLLCGARYERPIVEVPVPNELVVPMVLERSAATAMHYGR